ncbi:MAG: hypothetical protein JNL74_10430 [Fibrobacteres bacterium]|nr:hypothetical protein [Fibrobacterota bacterium]
MKLFPSSENEPVDLLLKRLNKEEKSVMEFYFGLGIETASSMFEIAGKLGITLEKVQEIKRRAIEKLAFRWDNWYSAA